MSIFFMMELNKTSSIIENSSKSHYVITQNCLSHLLATHGAGLVPFQHLGMTAFRRWKVLGFFLFIRNIYTLHLSTNRALEHDIIVISKQPPTLRQLINHISAIGTFKFIKEVRHIRYFDCLQTLFIERLGLNGSLLP